MRTVTNLGEWGRLDRPVLVTLGNFDGLHLGHRKIIETLVRRSKACKGEAVVVTFDPHPRKVLKPECRLGLMTSMKHRLKLIESLDVDATVIIPFDIDFSKISAESFVKEVLYPPLKFVELIVGRNYVFGKDRLGNTDLLQRLGEELCFKIDLIEPVEVGQHFVSSSLLRGLICEGELGKASKLLGRLFSIQGCVVKGRGMGSRLGFPTANIDLEEMVRPPRGVYAVRVEIGDERHLGVANLGIRPTFGSFEKEELEVYILDFDHEIYGCDIEISFVKRMRDEIQFEDVFKLKQQIEQDVESVRKLCYSLGRK